MKLDRKGCTRIVLLIGKLAIKIPNFTYCHQHFLQGCYSNWSERRYYKVHSKADYQGNMAYWVAPSYFCSWFGLIQIQARCTPNKEDLTDEELNFYKELHNGDKKKENFGYYQGRLVCLDYP